MIAVAGDIDVQSIEGVDHLLPFENVRQYGWREAISREQDDVLRVCGLELPKIGLEVDDTSISLFTRLDVVYVIEMENREQRLRLFLLH